MNIQLEFNIEDKTDDQVKFDLMQKQIDAMNDSMGKVRRKIFSEVGDLKKLVFGLQQENETLKNQLNMMQNIKTEWVYSQDNELFKVKVG